MTGSNCSNHLRIPALLLLFTPSTAFAPHSGTRSKIYHPYPLHASSGEDIRQDRSKSFSPIETVTSTPNTRDGRYSNNVASHVSTLYDSGAVVQDFQEGSAAKHTAPNRADAYVGSYGAVASTSARGEVLQDFRVGSASKHTVAGNISPVNSGTTMGAVTSYASALNPNDPAYPGGKHYQLEELEDAETCTTDIFLNPDNTINVGTTNGPLFLSGRGTWTTSPATEGDGKYSFEMIMTRRYQTGKEGTQQTDIGEFEYDVERTFRGELTLVGGTTLAMNGEILDVDETFGDRKVGFFNMIDTTEARKDDSVDR